MSNELVGVGADCAKGAAALVDEDLLEDISLNDIYIAMKKEIGNGVQLFNLGLIEL